MMFGGLMALAVSSPARSARRLGGVAGLVQTILPPLGFLAAIIIPALMFRNRRGLQVS